MTDATAGVHRRTRQRGGVAARGADSGSAEASAGYMAAFRKGLGETGYVEGQNVTVEYH